MLIIICHHFVAKNSYNIDTEINGISAGKLFLQFIGNLAFIANNLFFMISAWFLYNFDSRTSIKSTFKKIWKLEQVMLFYSILIPIVFYFFDPNHYADSNGFKFDYLIPLASNLWWYPTSYAIFLLFYPYYSKGLSILGKKDLGTLIATMLVIWSIPTLIPVNLSLGGGNTTNFFMLFAIIFYIRKYTPQWANDSKYIKITILLGFLLTISSIVILDILSQSYPTIGKYSCYFIRGNYRIFPVIISISLFLWWNRQNFKTSAIVNSIGSLTFAVYLIHMHPMMMSYLFEKKFVLSNYIGSIWLPISTLVITLIIFFFCITTEKIRIILFRRVSILVSPLRKFKTEKQL